MNYFIYIDKILALRTNLNKFSWLYGTLAPKATCSEYENCRIKIDLDVCSSKDVFEKDFNPYDFLKFHYFYAKENENKIYYERKVIGSFKLRYSIAIKENTITVKASRGYMKFIKYRFMGLHSMSHILSDIVSALLLKNSFATVYCSAVSKDDKTLLTFSAPNTGKTITSIRLCENWGFNFMSEDIALTDGQNVWAVPWTSTFRCYGNLGKTRSKLIDKIINRIPFLSTIPVRKRTIFDYLGDNRIKNMSIATNLVILERGHSRENCNKESGIQKIKNFQRYLLYYHKSPALIAMDYFNSNFPVEELIEKENEIITKLMEKCDYICLREDNVFKYSDLILEKIG